MKEVIKIIKEKKVRFCTSSSYSLVKLFTLPLLFVSGLQLKHSLLASRDSSSGTSNDDGVVFIVFVTLLSIWFVFLQSNFVCCLHQKFCATLF